MTKLQQDNVKRKSINERESFRFIVQNLMDVNNSRSAMDVVTGKQFSRMSGTATAGQSIFAGSNANFMAVAPPYPVPPDPDP